MTKYRAVPVCEHGLSKQEALATGHAWKKDFDSQREYVRWTHLKFMESAGYIANLQRQVAFPLRTSRGAVIAKWVADFVYDRDLLRVVEDCKGFRTPTYRLKKKWVEADYEFLILET